MWSMVNYVLKRGWWLRKFLDVTDHLHNFKICLRNYQILGSRWSSTVFEGVVDDSEDFVGCVR